MEVGKFAQLRVVRLRADGAFLAWGSSQELFLPSMEQVGRLRKDDLISVYITVDQSNRPRASMRLREHLQHDPSALRVGQKVELLILDQSNLGYEAIIDHKHLGILYRNEVFQKLRRGQLTTGYVKKIRSDGKVDLQLAAPGVKGSDEIGERILGEVWARGGFLEVTDKTDPKVIQSLFQVSKKKFKMALGRLYKNRRVVIESNGIRAVKED